MEKVLKKKGAVGGPWNLLRKREFALVMGAIGFFLGRVTLFQFMNPVILSYLSHFTGEGSSFFIIGAIAAIGITTRFSGLYLLKYISALILLFGTELFLSAAGIKLRGRGKALPACFVSLITCLIFAYLSGFGFYPLLFALMESALVFMLYMVLNQGITIVRGTGDKRAIDSETVISLAILLGGVLSGAADVYISSISLKYVFSTLIILLMAFKGGSAVGAAAGVLLGFTLMLNGYASYALVGILSVAGMISGLMRGAGKIGAIIGFAAGGAITGLYLETGIFGKILLYSTALGSVMFYFVPKNFSLTANPIINQGASNVAYGRKTREFAAERLIDFSGSFRKLGDTLSSLSEKKVALSQKDVSKLIDDAAVKACAGCKFKAECWEENFYSTYQMSTVLLEICEREGDFSEIPTEIKGFCVKMEVFFSCVESLHQIYKNNIIWSNEIAESRRLISRQLWALSGIVEGLGQEISQEIKFNDVLEENISSALGSVKIDGENVLAAEDREGRYEISIDLKPCGSGRQCTKEIIPLVSRLAGRKMKKEAAQCYCVDGNLCKLRLVEEEKFFFLSAVSSITKDGSVKSGDSFSFMQLKKGRRLLTLSDGMGTGKRAREESEAAINLLEQLLESGFDAESAVIMINSVLVLKSGADSFSTLDIVLVDCYSGHAQFVKLGAAPSYILRNKSIIKIESQTLPIGILNDVDIKIRSVKLLDGDIIVMVTDGITDIKGGDTDWPAGYLAGLKSKTPQEIADGVTHEAAARSLGGVKDDMTALVSKVWTRP